MDDFIAKVFDYIPSNITLDKSIVNNIYQYLVSLGYTPTADDSFLIAYYIIDQSYSIQTVIDTTTMPDGLNTTLINRVCGYFLSAKISSGEISSDNFSYDDIVSSLKEGDTQVNYDTSTNKNALLKQLLDNLKLSGADVILKYRRIKW